jgi:DNA repair exonuclease SbcCD ATPase subunit
MGTAPRPVGKLAGAADHFEQELARYERLSSELARTTVQSEKSLGRKRHLLDEFTESEAELGVRLKSLLVAMNEARERQQHCMEVAVKAATDLRERAEQFSELMAKVTELGERARTASQPAGPLLTEADAKVSAEALAPLDHVSEQIHSVLSEADAIARSASAQNWPEVARDVNSLRQQLSSMHAKVTRLRADVARRTLS